MTQEQLPTVYEAWAKVMEEVRELAKTERHESPNARFMYRGIDALMNAVGPVLRKHRVLVIPAVRSASYRDVQTSSGKPAREVTVTVDYTIYGPAGDSIYGTSAGEAMDSGDKGTAKAMSVAYRVFLLQALTLPTDEPDPDSEAYQRSGVPTDAEVAQDTADRAQRATDPGTLTNVRQWAADRGYDQLLVRDADGNGLPLGRLLDRRLDQLDPSRLEDKHAAVDHALGRSGSGVDDGATPGSDASGEQPAEA